MEIWKPILGYEGRYEISNMGRVKTLLPNTKGIKYMSCTENDRGYTFVTLRKDWISKKIKVHRLVATAFIPNPENKPEVNHINGTKWDNRVENLEWNTSKENINHAVSVLNRKLGNQKGYFYNHKVVNDHKYVKLVQFTKEMEPIKVWNSIKEAHESLGVAVMSIYKVIYNEKRTCKGYKWKRLKDLSEGHRLEICQKFNIAV